MFYYVFFGMLVGNVEAPDDFIDPNRTLKQYYFWRCMAETVVLQLF